MKNKKVNVDWTKRWGRRGEYACIPTMTHQSPISWGWKGFYNMALKTPRHATSRVCMKMTLHHWYQLTPTLLRPTHPTPLLDVKNLIIQSTFSWSIRYEKFIQLLDCLVFVYCGKLDIRASPMYSMDCYLCGIKFAIFFYISGIDF